ncbi:MAG: HEAT repeat domain-containing protein, partial [Myxococcota bacterium]|nr:HEAT repeat domain-containing protein [Myxococcota bacterium]
MASTEKYLQYRGNIAAMVALGPKLLLCTLHPEEQPTPLYRIELDKAELDTRPSSGGRALVLDNDELFLLAPDGALLRGSVDAALSPLFCLAGAGAMAPLAQQRFAIAAGQTLVIIDRVKGVELQRFELEAPISALASDSSGVWLVAAREDGVLTVFDREDKDEWTISSTGKVHDGNVFAVCFERDELRVLSSGADSRLLSTHVRGNLEAEDRGGRAMHQGGALAIVLGKDDIFYTLGADSTIKQWSKTGRPLTLTSKDGVGDGVALCVGEYNGRPHLLQACKDNSIRAFILDAEGRMNDRSLVLRGALDWAQHELEAKDPKRREEALRKLAEYNDGGAIALLERAANILPDVALKVLATELLGASGNPRAVSPLEALLSASESAIRMAAFAGLLSRQGPSLRVLELALDVRQEDLGQAAVKQLEALAPKDEQAMMRLVGCLDREPQAVRMAAIDSIALLRPSGAEAELIAIRSTMPDVRVEALRRCLRRELLAEPAVQRALRRYAEDSDAGVRRTAFLVSVLSKPTLAEALRSRDKDLHRGFYELQVGPLESEDKLPKLKKANLQVSDEDRVPLVEAMASHALDTCLAGASGLAMLQDPRALGALLQLSRENQSDARVQTCRALQELGDERALQRLRLMLRDADAGVRDAAFSAVVKLLDAAPLDAAESGLMAEHVDVRRRGLQVLVKLAKKMAEPAGEKTSKRSKKDQQEADPRAWALLERALNDADPGLRSEAFKTVLNQRFRALDADSDGIDQTLRFALCSIHGDLRREVLGEVMGQMSEPWAWPLLLELLNDPDSALRAEAFEFARKKAKSRLLEALRAGLNSRHVDIRIEACRALIERKEEGAQLLLVQALEDEDNTVRQMAVDALATAGLESALQKAMGSRYANVRLRAACARAERGDDAARQPLLDEIAVERPTFEDERKLWEDYVVLALYGLSQLGDPSTLEQLARLCSYPEARIRLAAAHAMAWCAAPQQLTVLREALQHQDAAVKYYAAVGLAFCGDASGASIIASYVENNKRNKQQLRRKDNDVGPDLAFLGMLAALALGEQGRDALLAFLDHPDLDIHRRALLLTLLLELGWARETPQLALAAMSSRHPRTRLSAAWAVECWPERERFAELVTSLVNDRGDTVKPGPLSIDTIQKMAAFLAHDASTARMRVASLLWYLNDFDDENQVVARRWALLARRYESQMASCLSAAKKQAVAPSKELQSLVLGAYIGLLRQGGPESIRVSAIARLGSIAEKMRSEQDSIMLGSVFPSLLMALRDSYANVRKAAFEALLQLS